MQFFGYTRSPELTLVIEYFREGSIENYVLGEKPGPKLCLLFCVDMANAIEYLHSRMPSIVIHRDIKPANFLLTNSLRVKLGDFGIARARRSAVPARTAEMSSPNVSSCSLESMAVSERQPSTTEELTSNCGTVRFMAPEVASTDGSRTKGYSTKADIWSLGMVYYFVWERVLPGIEGHRTPATHFSALLAGRRPQFHKCPKPVRDLVSSMWRLDPTDRPTADKILGFLAALKCKSALIGGGHVVVSAPTRHTSDKCVACAPDHVP